MRVGREEREACVDVLQGHYAAGRLQDAELSERVEAALSATTRSDLEVLTDDLPGVRPRAGLQRPRRPWLIALAGTAAIGIAVAGGLAPGSTPSVAEPPADVCAATGEVLASGCPEVSPVQQQIITDADQADRIAQRVQELADRNPDQQLTGLAERAQVTAARASDATLSAQQLVLAADGTPDRDLMADLAKSSRKALDDTQQTLDRALDRIDG